MRVSRRAYLLISLGVVAAAAGGLRYVAKDRPDPDPPKIVAKIDPSIFTDDTKEPVFRSDAKLVSQLCTQSQFSGDAFGRWVGELKETPHFHSKLWEYAYILQAISERGLMEAGKKGVGFGVGQEPLPSVFANHGVEVLATDLEIDAATKAGWAQSKQHMSSIDVLNTRGIATPEDFKRLVSVRNVDMTNIPADVTGYDFAWSTCSLGHLGSLDKGLAFIEHSLATVKPGGLVVHTTEFNLSSNGETYETPGTVVYRKRDIQALVAKLRAQGHEIEVNFNYGKGELDQHVDLPPYSSDRHLRLRLGPYAVTSLGLIIRKNPTAAR